MHNRRRDVRLQHKDIRCLSSLYNKLLPSLGGRGKGVGLPCLSRQGRWRRSQFNKLHPSLGGRGKGESLQSFQALLPPVSPRVPA